MSEEKKIPAKKSDADKKREKDQLINLWMNNLDSDSADESPDTDKKEVVD